MNVAKHFSTALTYDEFIEKLGNNLQLYQLHYKKLNLNENDRSEIRRIKSRNILIITEPWCGDSLAALPIIKKIVESGNNWQLKVILRDENLDLMDHFLTNGSRAIPLFFFLDKQGEILFKWGPRPDAAQQIFEEHRQRIQDGEIAKQEVIKKIRHFYAKDRGQEIFKELMVLIKEYEK